MAIIVHNLTASPLALPVPFETVLAPLSQTRFDYIEYDTAVNDERVVRLITAGALRIKSEDVGVGERSWYANSLIVAKSGGDFTTIQAAIDSITDASFGKRYVIQVYPGTYEENLVMKAFVSLYGIGSSLFSEAATLVSNGTSVTWPDGAGIACIDSMIIQNVGAPDVGDRLFLVGSPGISIFVRNCLLQMDNPVLARTAIEFTGDAEMLMEGCSVSAEFGTVAGVGTVRGVHFNGDSSLVLRASDFQVDLDDPDDDLIVFDFEPTLTGGSLIMERCRGDIKASINNGAWTGIAAIVRCLGANTDFNGVGANLRVSNPGVAPGGTARAIILDKTGGEFPILQHAVICIDSGFGTAHVADVAAANELSILESAIEADALAVGAGGFTYSGSYRGPGGQRVGGNAPALFEGPEFVAQGASFQIPNMKSGINQGAASATAGELWHDTTDDTIKMGV